MSCKVYQIWGLKSSSSRTRDQVKAQRSFWQLYIGSFTQDLSDLTIKCQNMRHSFVSELNNEK